MWSVISNMSRIQYDSKVDTKNEIMYYFEGSIEYMKTINFMFFMNITAVLYIGSRSCN